MKKNLLYFFVLAISLLIPTQKIFSQNFSPVPSKIKVELNKLVYAEGDPITAIVYSEDANFRPTHPFLVFSSGTTKDVEFVKLVRLPRAGANVYTTQKPLRAHLGKGVSKNLDGILDIGIGELFYCMYYPKDSAALGKGREADIVFDYGIGENKKMETSRFKMIPELALTADENRYSKEHHHLGTLVTKKSLPLQLSSNQLIFYPASKQQLTNFLRFTRGRILMRDKKTERFDPKNLTGYLVEVDASHMDEALLPQLRTLWGKKDSIYSSNKETLQLLTMVFECLLEGYAVTVNPRLLSNRGYAYLDDQELTTSFASEQTSPSIEDPRFQLTRVWSFMALFDKDEISVPVAFLDQGFKPNEDFRGFPNDIHECDIETSILNPTGTLSGDCGPAKAEGLPTAGASFFGSKIWHGTGVVTVAGGLLNNGPIHCSSSTGADSTIESCVGTGGQVVVPMLYKVNLASYAFQMGNAMKLATDDGANIINISFGYPCKLLTNIFGWTPGICTVSDRATFCTAITAGLVAASSAVCSVAPLIDLLTFSPAGSVACGLAITAATAASGACYTTLLAGDVKSEMEDGVNYALQKGVIVVAAAGNKVVPAELPDVIRDIIDTDPGNQQTDVWDVIPANIPGVICVGACSNNPATNFQNEQFFGPRVNIWAPNPYPYVAPYIAPGADATLTSRDSTQSLDASSEATPYISGLIADIEAINPSLNPKTPGLTQAQIQAIPAQVLSLLVATAHTVPEMTALGFTDPMGERGNMVNPLKFVQQASVGVIPDFTSRGYDGTLNYINPEDPAALALNDLSIHAVPIPDAAVGTIINFPATGRGAKPLVDVDWWSWTTPAQPGLYSNGFVQLTAPLKNGVGDLLINDDMTPPTSTVINGDEFTKTYAIPSLVNSGIICSNNIASPVFQFKVAGKKRTVLADEDNLYKLKIIPPTVSALPTADRFDTPGGNLNATDPNDNNTGTAATLLGSGTEDWQFNSANNDLEISIPNLNFHNCNDIDWFNIQIPSDAQLQQLLAPKKCGVLTMLIEFAPGMDIRIVSQRRRIGLLLPPFIKNVSSYFIQNLDGSKYITLQPDQPGAYIPYNLKITIRWGIDWQCFLNSLDHVIPWPKWRLMIDGCVACGLLLPNSGIYAFNPAFNRSLGASFGAQNASGFLVNHPTGGALSIRLRSLGSAFRSVQLLDAQGNVVPASYKSADGFEILKTPELKAGVYTLLLEKGATNVKEINNRNENKFQAIVQ